MFLNNKMRGWNQRLAISVVEFVAVASFICASASDLELNQPWPCKNDSGRKGKCVVLDKPFAVNELIRAQDLGLVTGFLDHNVALDIAKKVKELDKGEWVVEKKEEEHFSFDRESRRMKPSWDYKMVDLQLEEFESLRADIEPHFEALKGSGQHLMLYLGKFPKGSHKSSNSGFLRHLEMGGQPMVRARGFYLYLNDEWTEDEGGIFYDEEDDERDHVPTFNTLIHHRVPRWHSISPIRTKKSLICIYGWVVQKRLSNWERTQAMAREIYQTPRAYMPLLFIVVVTIRLYFFPIELPDWFTNFFAARPKAADADKGAGKSGGGKAAKSTKKTK